jgi:hypothetical protein
VKNILRNKDKSRKVECKQDNTLLEVNDTETSNRTSEQREAKMAFGLNLGSMAIAGYVSVCVQLHCILVTVFHYMFRPTWPSSGV